MTCCKIIQNAGPNVPAAFIQIGNIAYPAEKADMLVFKIVGIILFSSAGQQNVTNLHLQIIFCVESTLPVDGATKGIFCISSTCSKSNTGV